MPRSHGGGFSGGGSSGGFSSGGNKHNAQTFSRHRPFYGCTRFIYVSNSGAERSFYYKGKPKKKNIPIRFFGMISLMLVVSVLFCLMIASNIPNKLLDGQCNATGIYLSDNADIVKDEEVFNQTMRIFYDITGIEPYMLTMTSDDFPSFAYGSLDKNSLEQYAYDRYLELFDDEGHYMIVFVMCEDSKFLWLDMSGNDASTLIDDNVFEKFKLEMVSKLNEYDDMGKAFAEGFENMQRDVFVITREDITAMAITAIIGLFVLIVLIISTVQMVENCKMINEYCEAEKRNQAKSQEYAEFSDDFDYINT